MRGPRGTGKVQRGEQAREENVFRFRGSEGYRILRTLAAKQEDTRKFFLYVLNPIASALAANDGNV